MKILTSINPDMAKRAESVLKSRFDPDKLYDDFIQRHFALFQRVASFTTNLQSANHTQAIRLNSESERIRHRHS